MNKATIQKALKAHQAGDLAKAKALYKNILAKKPRHAQANHLYGVLAHQTGKDDVAVKHIERAVAASPKYTVAWDNLGIAYQGLRQFDKAVHCHEKALALEPGFIKAMINLAAAYQASGKAEQALFWTEKALKSEPDNPQLLTNAGALYKGLGEMDKAMGFIESALAVKPNFGKAFTNLVKLKTFTDYDQEIKEKEALFHADTTRIADKIDIGFSLGKVFEDLGMYDKSFEYVHGANTLQRSTYTYDVAQDLQFMADIPKIFTRERISTPLDTALHDQTPIFVLGMPRSGTTLVEQVLAAHPNVYAAGELDTLMRIVKNTVDEMGTVFPASMLDSTQETLGRMAETYMAELREQSTDALRITDKMPKNFLFIGLIRMILPKAKIIHCNREPMDSAYSIYKNNFVSGDSGLGFAYDMEELGMYFKQYQRLMDHWFTVCPGIHEVWYEDMVASQEKETRKLIEFCDLEWDDACLEFYKARRMVATASSVQVRKPIYTSSVGLWKKFAPHIEPLRKKIYPEDAQDGVLPRVAP